MLLLTRRQFEQILDHSKQSYPREGCGILLGSVDGASKRVHQVELTPNQRTDRAERRYLISSDSVRSVQRRARSKGWEIIGFFHSHPDVAAIPSEFDRDHAWPWYSYLIVSVKHGICREHLAWTLKDDRSRFEPEAVEILVSHEASD